jgi:hypothetical protein
MKRDSFAGLLLESEGLEARATSLQSDARDHPPATEYRKLADDYIAWFARCLALLPEDIRSRFRGEYEGSAFTRKIRAFLEDPVGHSELVANLDENPLNLSLWQHPVDRCFVRPLLAQRQMLVEAEHQSADVPKSETLEFLGEISRRLQDFFDCLQGRGHGRPDFSVENEYDVQDMVHAILHLHFDDVRPEEYTPSYAGGSSRTDFLLKQEQLLVEVKMTRNSLVAKGVRNELAIDIVNYKSHPDCGSLFVLVYDPERRISNRRGFENDLSGDKHGMPVLVVVAP